MKMYAQSDSIRYQTSQNLFWHIDLASGGEDGSDFFQKSEKKYSMINTDNKMIGRRK